MPENDDVIPGARDPLIDPWLRRARYLCLSITEACSMRCVYCRPGDDRPRRDGELDTPSLLTLARHLVERRGIDKVRLTGGEPTSRPDLLRLIEGLATSDRLGDLAMTTNGLTLTRLAPALRSSGLRRVNVSLDSLRPDRFERMTGVGELGRVIAGIDRALSVGLALKLNCVVLRGENEHELGALVNFAADRQLPIRFIELMPMGPLAARWRQRYVPEAQMRKRLDAVVDDWGRPEQGSSAARLYRARLRDGRRATIGFISAMSCAFCDACDRIRITARGELFPCLMGEAAVNLRPAISPRFDPEHLDRLLTAGLSQKRLTHPARGFVPMTVLGG